MGATVLGLEADAGAMPECLFCRIAAGELPASVVLEDDRTLAFLDINPLAPGHTLVIPRAHATLLEELPPEEATALFRTVHRLAGPVREAVGAPASTIAVQDGAAAGQEIPHVHVHLVPRFEGDGGGPIHGLFRNPPDLSDDAMETIRAAIHDGAR